MQGRKAQMADRGSNSKSIASSHHIVSDLELARAKTDFITLSQVTAERTSAILEGSRNGYAGALS